MKIALLAALACGLAITAASADEKSAQDALAKVTSSCQSCHGAGGDSVKSNVPRLNGQTAGYLTARLKAFLDPTRQTPNATHAMWDIASHIGDTTVPEIAKYYARQAPAEAHNTGALAMEGKKLFEHGAGRNVPACQACHGLHGEGMGLAARLAGQHADYLAYQLNAFNVTMRDQDAMNHVSMNFTEAQIKALVAYLAKD